MENKMATDRSNKFNYLLLCLILVAIFFSACSSRADVATPPSPTSLPEATITESVKPTLEIPATPVPPPTPQPISIEDGLGREVTLFEPAQRIVSLAPSNTEILFAIGAGGNIVGRDEFSDYPNSAKELLSVGGSFGDYNLEAIVDLQPDLIIAAEINTPEQVKALEDLGLNVFYLSNPTTLEEMYTNLITVATLTGHVDEANKLVDSLRQRVSNVEQIITSAGNQPSVFYELDATDPSAPWTAGRGTFIDSLITKAGGINITSDLEGQYLQISIEELLIRDPEIILLGDSAYGITKESLLGRPGWININAILNERIYTFDDNLVSRPGPRLVDGFEELARLLHPELFNDE
jgi:iron complex transport system substrate-binding protein